MGNLVPAKVTRRIVFLSILCVRPVGVVSPFHHEDENVARRVLKRNMDNRGTKSYSKRLGNVQELGIGAE